MTTETTDKALYAAYAESAPRLDLAFYVDYAQQRRDGYSVATRAIVSEMIALLDELTDAPKGSPSAQKKLVWALIARFKASIAGWSDYGFAADADYRILSSRIARWVTYGRCSVLLDPKTPRIEAPDREAPPVVRQPKAPTWRERAIAAEAKLKALEAERAQPVRVPHRRTGPRTVKVAAPISTDSTRECRGCHIEQPIDRFIYDGGRSVRTLCKTCKNAAAAVARKRAA